ncbi:calcium homeostasis modulator protein 6-like [Oculina patagonica]
MKDDKKQDGDPKGSSDTGKGISQWLRNKAQNLGEKASKLKGLKAISLIQNNSVTSRNLLVAAATGGLEHLLNAKAFNCPENNYRLYGYTFLFGPIVILFCVNVLVIGELWKLTSRRYIRRYHRRGDFIARLIPSLLKACVGPAVWLIVAFLEEDYYLCAKLGPLPSKGNETSELEMNELKKKIEEEKSHSHVWAWVVLVALVVCGTVVVVCKHCFVKDNILTPSK